LASTRLPARCSARVNRTDLARRLGVRPGNEGHNLADVIAGALPRQGIEFLTLFHDIASLATRRAGAAGWPPSIRAVAAHSALERLDPAQSGDIGNTLVRRHG
jgi:hypothetical protein